MANFVIKDGIKYEVIGSEADRLYVIYEDVGVGENCYCAEAFLQDDGLWYVKFSYENRITYELNQVLFVMKDVPVKIMSDRPYDAKARMDGMSFRSAVQYMWKVIKCCTYRWPTKREPVGMKEV